MQLPEKCQHNTGEYLPVFLEYSRLLTGTQLGTVSNGARCVVAADGGPEPPAGVAQSAGTRDPLPRHQERRATPGGRRVVGQFES